MKRLLAVVVIAACGGPTQQQLAETPSATAPARPAEAPPASTSDKDRERAVQQFDDMQTTQNAYREAGAEQGSAAQKPPPPTNPRKAPVEQAPKNPKKAPVEQAPK
jgi:hypothetical protein